MYVKKKKKLPQKNKKQDTELKEDDIKKMVLLIHLHLLRRLGK